MSGSADAALVLGVFPVADGWGGGKPGGFASIDLTAEVLGDLEALMDEARATRNQSVHGLLEQGYHAPGHIDFRKLERSVLVDPERAVLDNVVERVNESVRSVDVSWKVPRQAPEDEPYQLYLVTDGEKLHWRVQDLSSTASYGRAAETGDLTRADLALGGLYVCSDDELGRRFRDLSTGRPIRALRILVEGLKARGADGAVREVLPHLSPDDLLPLLQCDHAPVRQEALSLAAEAGLDPELADRGSGQRERSR